MALAAPIRWVLFFTLIPSVVFGKGLPQCSLNGIKKDEGTCVCDKPWTGPVCGQLKVLPVSFPQGYGMLPNLTTWGGDMFIEGSGSNKKYHLLVSSLNGCSLRHWHAHSRIEHAVSDTITGPYQFKDVALPVFSHNPKIIRLKGGKLALIHIGQVASPFQDDGIEKKCTNWDDDVNPKLFTTEKNSDIPSQRHLRYNQHFATRSKGSSTIHIAETIDGPWIPLINNTLGRCNNPAPFVVDKNANGKGDQGIYIVCNHDTLEHAPDIWGPWTTVSKTTPFPESAGTNEFTADLTAGSLHYEDPELYIDKRGFHIIYHLYDTEENPPHGHECRNSTVSAHVFSEDGHHWYQSSGQPYGTRVDLTNGESLTVATKERPSLVFQKDETGHLQMTHLITAACSAETCPDGPPEGCVNCKYDHWDYTLIQPLDVG